MPATVQSPADLDALIARASAPRDLHEYAIPAALRREASGITHLRMVELTVDEELIAARRSGADPIMLAWELAKESLRGLVRQRITRDGSGAEVVHADEVRLGTGDGSLDATWREMHPKLRQLAITAYGDIHNPKEADTKAFLQSGRVIAG